jgi:hypothetical protein
MTRALGGVGGGDFAADLLTKVGDRGLTVGVGEHVGGVDQDPAVPIR